MTEPHAPIDRPAPQPRLPDGSAADLAGREPLVLGPDDLVVDAARLMAAQRRSFVLVLDADRRALGVVTESLLLQALSDAVPPTQPVRSLMQPAVCVPATLDAADACRRCADADSGPLVLLDAAGQVCGAIDETDVRAHLRLATLAGRHRVVSVMMRVLRPLSPDDPVSAAVEQMRGAHDTAVVVVEGERAVGVLTAADVARLLAVRTDCDALRLRQAMSSPVRSLPVDASINEAAEAMLAQRIRHLVVNDAAGHVVGVLDEHELTRALTVQVMDSGVERERVLKQAVIDAIPDPVWMKDPQGVYVTCNRRFETLYGAPEAQVRGRTDFDFVSRERAEYFRATDRQVIDSGTVNTSEETLSFADGHEERVQTIKAPVHDREGRLMGVLGVARDISELRRAEEQYRWLFARNPAPMYVYLRESLRICKVNEAFCRLYGYSEAESLRMQLTDLYLPEDRERVRTHVPQLRGLADLGQWRHLRRGGSVVHVVAQSHDIRHEGAEGRMVVITDVSELERSRRRDRQRLALMERMSRGDALDILLSQLVRDHESLFPGSLCSVLLRDADEPVLRLAAAPSLPDFYNQAVDGLPIGLGSGSCGEAAFTGHRVVATDVEEHPNWVDFRELARRAGVRSCWSEPIVGSGGRVLGTFAVYRRDTAGPALDEQDHMQFAVQLAATAITQTSVSNAVAEQQRLIDAMFAQTTDSIVLVDPQTKRFVNFNAAAYEGLGYTREQFANLTPMDLRSDADPAEVASVNQRALAGEQVHFEVQHRRADGGLQDASLRLSRVEFGGRTLVCGVWRDITSERSRELRIQRLNRSYALLSGINEAVVRLREPQALFGELCRIAVEVGGFRLAWVGSLDAAASQIAPVTWWGQHDGFLARLRLPTSGDHAGPVPMAYLRQQPQVVPDVAHEPTLQHRHEALSAMGLHSLAVFPIVAPGGRWHCLAVYSGATDHFDDEQVALLARLARDIEFALQFIAAEQARDEAQRFREQLIESVAGLFYALDRRGRLLLWNRRFEEVSGRSAMELAGAGMAEFFDAEHGQQAGEVLRRVLEEGEVQIEAPLKLPGGRSVPHLFVARRVDTDNGPLVVGTGVDISDRVRSEGELARDRSTLEDQVRQRTVELESVNARLHREDRRLRAMLALSQRASTLDEDALFKAGLDEILVLTGSPTGCLHVVGEGDDPNRLQLKAWAGAAEPPTEVFALQIAEQASGCLVDGPQLAQLTRCGTAVERAIGAPALDGGRAVLVVCAANRPEPYEEVDLRELKLLAGDLWEIVQRRRIEIALGHAKVAADAASQAKSAFLANMSHEIRTPMNAIIGFAHLLRRDPLTGRQQDHLAKITDAGQHLMQVINDILDFSKIEAHKVTLEEADFPLRDSLERVRSMQADAARAKQLPLDLLVDPHCPPLVRGDRLRLEQVLLNLLSNAVKFTAAGRVELRVQVLPVAGPDAASVLLRFEVADTGIGMSAEQVAHVFEAFAQADVSTTRRYGGTGLGLAISKRLVQLMQGRIGVRSQPGVGSTFWVEVPLHRALAAATRRTETPPPPAVSVQLHGRSILVVEDNPVNQEVTATLLAALGADVELAGSGEEALRRFDATRHDLVLMDVQMPGMDGLLATETLRQRPDGADVPIVAMTANAFAEDRAQCLAAGMNDYLAKPVEPQALERCLLRWLAPTEPAPPAAAPPAPADPQQRLRQQLEEIHVLDTVGPVARMRGAWPLYLRMLRMFVAHHGGDVARLQDPAVAGDAQALRALAHSIAGAAATVGATEVAQLAQALQAHLNAGGAAGDAMARPLAQALQRCLGGVQAAFDEADRGEAPPLSPAPPPVADAAAVRRALDELQPLLAAHDTQALPVFERQRALLAAALPDGAAELGAHLQDFSFGAALAVLERLRAHL